MRFATRSHFFALSPLAREWGRASPALSVWDALDGIAPRCDTCRTKAGHPSIGALSMPHVKPDPRLQPFAAVLFGAVVGGLAVEAIMPALRAIDLIGVT